MPSIVLQGEIDLEGFRHQARRLLLAGCAPDQVQWHTPVSARADLFADDDGPDACASVAPRGLHATNDADERAAAAGSGVQLPRGFLQLCARVVLHQAASRFALMYRLAWRLYTGDAAWSDTLDPDRVAAEHLAHAVRREMHKMTAFVRFRPVGQGAGIPDLHVAWFEPEHHIVEATAGFFCRRFANMRWAILTPRRCLLWEHGQLRSMPGVSRDQAPQADAGEQRWLTYYASIFNPARLKLGMMRKEMPRRYWANLPEATLISGLSVQAAGRTGAMIDATPTLPQRRIPQHVHAPVGSEIAAGSTGRRTAATLDALAQQLSACNACPLAASATQAVAGQGPAQARLMLVGEQPGDQEDLRGVPFVGPAGQLLMRAFATLGWNRQQLYVTNAVKHFKFTLRGKRRMHKTAAQREVLACQQWLEHEIALVQPEAIVALGATAAFALLGAVVSVTRGRGQWHERADGRRVLLTWHPSALLRLPESQQAQAFAQWTDDLRLAAGFAGPVVRGEPAA